MHTRSDSAAPRTALKAFLLTACACSLAACASTVATQRTTPAAQLTSARVDDPTFALALSAPQSISVGTPVSADLSIEGRGIYHVNEEYPLRIVLRSTGDVALAHTELGGTNAAELTPARARFDLPFTCRAPGTHSIEADVEFALCTEDACIPQARTITLTVQAH
jgi:hypothetical protein